MRVRVDTRNRATESDLCQVCVNGPHPRNSSQQNGSELMVPKLQDQEEYQEGREVFLRSHTSLFGSGFSCSIFWAREYPVTKVDRMSGVEASTAFDVYQWLREVCSMKLLQTPIILGGQEHLCSNQ